MWRNFTTAVCFAVLDHVGGGVKTEENSRLKSMLPYFTVYWTLSVSKNIHDLILWYVILLMAHKLCFT